MTMIARKILNIAVPLVGAATLAACATPFRAEVSRFERLPAVEGQSFFVTTQNPALKGGIEFETYANLVSSELARQGYSPAASPESADLIVNMDYDVDNGQQRVVSDYTPYYGGGYGYFGRPFGYYGYPYRGYYSRARYVYGWHDPFYFDAAPRVRSYTYYTSELDVDIDRAADGVRLFEGKAMARSRDDNLTYLVPNLVEAMFTGFPGNSGETVRITIKDEDD